MHGTHGKVRHQLTMVVVEMRHFLNEKWRSSGAGEWRSSFGGVVRKERRRSPEREKEGSSFDCIVLQTRPRRSHEEQGKSLLV